MNLVNCYDEFLPVGLLYVQITDLSILNYIKKKMILPDIFVGKKKIFRKYTHWSTVIIALITFLNH